MHLGDNVWMVVDSCIDHSSGKPVALQYLESLGLDPAESVKLIVCSHWHDDHIRGMSELVRRCPNASFFASRALFSKDFVKLVSASSERALMRSSSGVDEFNGVIEELLRRRRASKEQYAGSGFRFATCDQRIWMGAAGSLAAEVWTLSPSDAEYEASLRDIAGLLPKLDIGRAPETRRRVLPIRRNNTAVAVWAKTDLAEVLLGADLEEVGLVDCGWTAIVNSTARPQGNGSLFKIPHHGSATGHCAAVWDKMLQKGAIAILTPFQLGSVKLPGTRDIERIKALAGAAYISQCREPKKAKASDRVISRAFSESTLSIREVGTAGRVSAFFDTGSLPPTWTIDLANGAGAL